MNEYLFEIMTDEDRDFYISKKKHERIFRNGEEYSSDIYSETCEEVA